MASKKSAGEAAAGEKRRRKNEKVNVFLSPEQIAWLETDKGGPSAAVRALITEAMNLDNLQKSVKGGKKSTGKQK